MGLTLPRSTTASPDVDHLDHDATPAEPRDGLFGDPAIEGTVLALVSSMAELLGFAASGVAVATNDGRLVDLSASGSAEVRPTARVRSLQYWVDQLDSAVEWGGVLLLPATGSRGEKVVVRLHDRHHQFVGFVWISRPGGARDTLDLAGRDLAERICQKIAEVVAAGLRRRRQSEQVHLVMTSRAVVRGASHELDVGAIMEQVGPPLLAGFQAMGLWLMIETSPTEMRTMIFTDPDVRELPDMTPAQGSLARRIAHQAWAQQRVGALSLTRLRGGLLSLTEVMEVRNFLADTQVGSLLFIPVGVGDECLGCLVMAREEDAPLWSEPELEIALDLGHDVGRAVFNARSHQRERDLVRELEAAAARRMRLIRTMSHEIKSPLTAILANLELAGASFGSSDGPDELDGLGPDALLGIRGADRGAQRLAHLVDDMLTLARNSDDAAPVRTGPVDMAEIVRAAVELKVVEARRADITIDVVAARGDNILQGDGPALELVVENLISNAVKYSERGGRVTVELSCDEAAVVLTCTDEGIGMTADDVTHIFDEFYRSPQPQAQKRPGTGLGMAIAERIVRRHGGNIVCFSELGRGTTFRVELPSDPDQAAGPTPP